VNRYEVTTDLLVSVRVKLLIDAPDAAAAIDAAIEQMPAGYDPEQSAAWKARVEIVPPKGVTIVGEPKAYHFAAQTGAEKAKRRAP
jgi:hypothetical protein